MSLALELYKQVQRERAHSLRLLSREETEQPPELCWVFLAVSEARQQLWQGSKPQRDSLHEEKKAKSKGFEALHHVRVFMPLGFQ